MARYGRLTQLHLGIAKLRDNAGEVASDYEKFLDSQMRLMAVEGAAHMKTHAPWGDDTGRARSTLFTVTELKSSRKKIVFSHGVDYGIWLEIEHNGEHQVIMPSVHEIGKRLFKSLRGSMKTLRENRIT